MLANKNTSLREAKRRSNLLRRVTYHEIAAFRFTQLAMTEVLPDTCACHW